MFWLFYHSVSPWESGSQLYSQCLPSRRYSVNNCIINKLISNITHCPNDWAFYLISRYWKCSGQAECLRQSALRHSLQKEWTYNKSIEERCRFYWRIHRREKEGFAIWLLFSTVSVLILPNWGAMPPPFRYVALSLCIPPLSSPPLSFRGFQLCAQIFIQTNKGLEYNKAQPLKEIWWLAFI